MILIWGLAQDPSTRMVHDCLERRRAAVFFLNHAEIFDTTVFLTTSRKLCYTVECGGRSFCLDDCFAAYLRPYDYRDYSTSQSLSGPAMVHHLISAWAQDTPAMVISRPSAEGTNQSKLYQAIAIRRTGFLTPQSLVSNDPAVIREFHALHGRLIYKSMSNVRSIVKELSLDGLADHPLGPMQFQQRIEGRNVRVHVVGEECFACAIDSDGVDYRYASSRMAQMGLPDAIALRAVELTKSLGLYLAGLDLIETPSGEWYCLEVNPNPAFAAFAGADKVAQTVARRLCAEGGASEYGRVYPSLRELLCQTA